jgi:hypothetical protein
LTVGLATRDPAEEDEIIPRIETRVRRRVRGERAISMVPLQTTAGLKAAS